MSRRTLIVLVVGAVIVLGIIVPLVMATSGGGHNHPSKALASSRR